MIVREDQTMADGDRVTMAQVRATYKARDSWWTVLLVDPVAGRLVRAAAPYRWLTPNRITAVAFLLGLGAAGAFLAGAPGWLVAGALLYHLGFVLDCVDGKIARLHGTGSIFGGWLDFFLDRVRVVLCAVALFAGQWRQTGADVFLFVAIGVVFLALFGYVNGAATDQARARLAERRAQQGLGQPDEESLLRTAAGPAAGLAGRVRDTLHRHRIRMNLVSGIEFEMAVLVVAPLVAALTGPYAVVWVTAAAAAPLVLFELSLIARFWLATRGS
jgi:phosphatidylglycerophosphate synthase